MDDRELERRLGELKESWRIPRDPPLEAIWQAVEAKAFSATNPRRRPWTRLLPMAAMLVLGFGLGRLLPATLGKRPPGAVVTASMPPVVQVVDSRAPFVGIATDYLERVTALLVTLTEASRRGQSPANSTVQARDLLATTRLLMDSPEARDPHLKELLDDLELVLAQIVRLPHRAAAPDVYLIDQTLDQREVLPRLRGFLAENSTSQP
jgi:hypothetical protein